MIVDIRPMLRGETKKIAVNYAMTPMLPSDVIAEGNASVNGEIIDEGGYMRLTLTADVPYVTACARCLTEVHTVFHVTLERTVATENMLTPGQIEENVDEYIVVKDGMLDADETLREEIFLCFPMRTLCDDDCQGLCPKCGRPKRENCGCDLTEVDPRMAVFKDLFKNN